MSAPGLLRRVWRVTGWMLVALVIYLSLTSNPPPLPGQLGDKWGHFLAYGTLMWWFGQLHTRWPERLGYAIFFAALGIGLEFIQGIVGYRMLDYYDAVANVIGLVIGWLASLPRLPSLSRLLERQGRR